MSFDSDHIFHRVDNHVWITCDGKTVAEKTLKDQYDIPEFQRWFEEAKRDHKLICPNRYEE